MGLFCFAFRLSLSVATLSPDAIKRGHPVLITCFSPKEEGKHKKLNGKSLSSSVLRRLNITNDFGVFRRCIISTDYER